MWRGEWTCALRRAGFNPPLSMPFNMRTRSIMTKYLLVAAVAIALSSATMSRADDWPQWMGPGRDNVWHESGIVEKFPAAGPAIRWRVRVGPGYSSPTVAGGRVFLIDRQVNEGAPKPPTPFARL